MFTYPEVPASSEGPAEIGPPPYYHRSDCNICRQQDGLKTGSELLHRLVSRGEKDVVLHCLAATVHVLDPNPPALRI
jgi:hypothetical protein